MHPIPYARRPLLLGLTLAAGLVATTAFAQPGGPPPDPTKIQDVQVDPKTGALVVPLGGVVQFDPKMGPIQDVVVSREGVIGFRPGSTPNVVLLNGLAPGQVRLTLTFKDRPPLAVDVIVLIDVELLRTMIKRTVPTANVDVTPGIGNVVVLSGYVTSPQDADIVARLANSMVGGQANNVINAVQIGGVQQVQIDVVVASVDRNEIRTRGFDFAVNGSTIKFTSVVSGLIGSTGFAGGTPTASPEANLQMGIVPSQFFAALRALRTEGMAKFLAEPRVVTQTGRPASFLAGGRQAVLGPAAGINGPGVTYENIGTQLDVLPIVYGNNQIWLEISPSVRTVNQGLGITTVFGSTPGFSENSIRCAVMLESGQTFAIGGLIQNSVQASASRIPVLGDLPFVGTAFSRVNYEERESELIILVTPRLVAPLDCSQVPKRLPGRETRTPDDYELFLEGVLEAPRGQRKVWTGKCYNAPYKCDPSVCNYPCAGNVCTGPNCGPVAGGCATPAFGQPLAPGFTAAPQVAPGVTPAATTWSQNPATTAPATVMPSASFPQPMPATLPAGPLPAIPVAPAGDAGAGLPPLPMPPQR
jgi:pilus assembly protein CpaC